MQKYKSDHKENRQLRTHKKIPWDDSKKHSANDELSSYLTQTHILQWIFSLRIEQLLLKKENKIIKEECAEIKLRVTP